MIKKEVIITRELRDITLASLIGESPKFSSMAELMRQIVQDYKLGDFTVAPRPAADDVTVGFMPDLDEWKAAVARAQNEGVTMRQVVEMGIIDYLETIY